MYLAATLMLLGAGLFFGSIPMLLPPLAFLLTMNMVFIPYEEDAIEEAFGEQYLNYRRPGVWMKPGGTM